jgi:FkbM family methyltransferase
MGFCKESVRSILRNVFGLDVRKLKNIPSPAEPVVAGFRQFGIDLVLDVGANKGQFASEIRHCGYAGKIVSFEPLSQAHGELLQSSAGDPMWDAYPRCALGDHNGEVEINIAGNSESSSILPMLESHRNAAPESAYQGKGIVPIKTLDAVAGQYLKYARSPFLTSRGYWWSYLLCRFTKASICGAR